jgi:hypothetical protein
MQHRVDYFTRMKIMQKILILNHVLTGYLIPLSLSNLWVISLSKFLVFLGHKESVIRPSSEPAECSSVLHKLILSYYPPNTPASLTVELEAGMCHHPGKYAV